jgi:hypothetical protein
MFFYVSQAECIKESYTQLKYEIPLVDFLDIKEFCDVQNSLAEEQREKEKRQSKGRGG